MPVRTPTQYVGLWHCRSKTYAVVTFAGVGTNAENQYFVHIIEGIRARRPAGALLVSDDILDTMIAKWYMKISDDPES